MTSTPTVREARPHEGGAVTALLRAAYLAYADALPADLLEAWIDDVLDPGAGCTLVAVVDGRIAGTARWYPTGSYPAPLPAGSAGVRAVAVAPRHRRTGVASALMVACAARARAAGATALHLHTAPFMTAAAALYVGLGYRRDPAADLDLGVRFGTAPPGEAVVTAYRLELAPGGGGDPCGAGSTDPGEQQKAVSLSGLDDVSHGGSP